MNAKILYKNKVHKELQTSEEKVTAIKTYGYTKQENGIMYLAKEGQTFNDTLVFSDDNCDIFYTGDKNFELWVNEKKIKGVPSCCKFAFSYFARNFGKIHNIYTDDCYLAPGSVAGESK
nr:Tick histamine binding protein [Mycolicibacterium malmesburyense]